MYKVWKNVPLEERERIASLPFIEGQYQSHKSRLLMSSGTTCPLGAFDDLDWRWPSPPEALAYLSLRGWADGVTLANVRTFIKAFDSGRLGTTKKLREALGV